MGGIEGIGTMKCCCDGCFYVYDRFARYPDGEPNEIGAHYHIISGTFQRAGGSLVCTAEGSFYSAQRAASREQTISCTFEQSQPLGCIVRIYPNSSTTPGAIYGEMMIEADGVGYVKAVGSETKTLHIRETGTRVYSETESRNFVVCVQEFEAAGWFMTVEMNGSLLNLNGYWGLTVPIAEPDDDPANFGFVFEVADLASGNVSLSFLIANTRGDQLNNAQCGACSGTSGCEGVFDVELAGVTGADANNGTYTLEEYADGPGFNVITAGGPLDNFTMAYDDAANETTIDANIMGDCARFQSVVSGRITCASIIGDIPLVSVDLPSCVQYPGFDYDPSSATLAITSAVIP